MNLYDVLADGYHTPLTTTEIAELFHAGHLRRQDPCKAIDKKEWRTIDELFPLLKYQPSVPATDAIYPGVPIPKTTILVVGLSLAAVALVALLIYFFTGGTIRDFKSADRSEIDPTRRISSASTSQTSGSLPMVNIAPSNSSVPHYQQQSGGTFAVPDYSGEAPNQRVDLERARLAQERETAAQRERERTQAAKLAQERVNAQRREVEQRKAAGSDVVIPLDQFTDIHAGGMSVSVNVHDNDVSSFDVWINGSRRRDVKKNKGITQSGTDETLIYSNGRARLYYVWEISGRLNHCLLRVRDD